MPIVQLDLEVDTQSADADELRAILLGWNILHSTAILNDRWREFSARSFVKDLGLREVKWSVTGDDTPGTLYLSLARRNEAESQTKSGFEQIEGVEVYPVEEDAVGR